VKLRYFAGGLQHRDAVAFGIGTRKPGAGRVMVTNVTVGAVLWAGGREAAMAVAASGWWVESWRRVGFGVEKGE